MLPNGLQYTRRWMVKILGEEMVDAMFDFAKRFNAVNFTVEEQALILPVVICFHGKLPDSSLDEKSFSIPFRYCIERSGNRTKYSTVLFVCTVHTNVDDTFIIRCKNYIPQFVTSLFSFEIERETKSSEIFFVLCQIFASLPFLNELQEKKIAPLIPESKCL